MAVLTAIRKILRRAMGFVLFMVGIVVSVPVLVPGWGLPFIVAGLAILAPEYQWAGRLHRKADDLYRRMLARIKARS
ncbi:hypothetical protein HY522_10495 [bacterium]|nr:hypothetical protein [bacterium]